jgi:hypothetical protein
MKTLRILAGLVMAALLFGCGGGGGGGTPATPTPAGTAVSFATFKGFIIGTAAAGSQVSFNLTGSDSQGSAWTGSLAVVSDGASTFEAQNVTNSRVLTTLTRTATGVTASGIETLYFLTANGNLYKQVSSSGTTGVPAAQTQLPAIGHVGESASLWTLSESDGSTETLAWRLDPDVNGNSKLVLSSVTRDGSNAVTTVEDNTFFLDASGNPFRFSVTVTTGGVTVSLAGNRN